MQPLSIPEIRTGSGYELVRRDALQKLADIKRPRRVALGDALCVVFENRLTLQVSIEEALRAERLADPAEVAIEVDAFNALIPDEGELIATLYVEVADPADLTARLEEMAGIERSVYLEIAGERIMGKPRDTAVESVNPVHLLGFALAAADRERWTAGADVAVGTAAPQRALRSALNSEQRAALLIDVG